MREQRGRSTWDQLRNVAYGLLFTRSDTDDILVTPRGEKASFTLLYAAKGWERHFTVTSRICRRAGVDMKLQLLEPARRSSGRWSENSRWSISACPAACSRAAAYLATEFKWRP
jgi:hypothetical protein